MRPRWKPIWKAKCPSNEELMKLIRKGTIELAFNPILCGTAFKNKVFSPCSTRLSIICLRRSMFWRSRVSIRKTETEVLRKADDGEPDLAAGLQDHERPVRGLAHLLPRLFRSC